MSKADELLREYFDALDADHKIVGSTCRLIRAKGACRDYLTDLANEKPPAGPLELVSACRKHGTRTADLLFNREPTDDEFMALMGAIQAHFKDAVGEATRSTAPSKRGESNVSAPASPPHAAADEWEQMRDRAIAAINRAQDAAAEPEKPMNETGGDAPDAITTLRAENERLRGAILWALGYGDFSERQPGQGAYWWRIELAQRAAIQPLYASPSAQPIARDEQDAKRYRWLRERIDDNGCGKARLTADICIDFYNCGMSLDEAIDYALKSAGKEST